MTEKTDLWMPILIGDYLRDTQHLDAERHGCYLLWLMHYWVHGPLPNSIEDLVLIGRLRGPDAPSIAQAMLASFFTLESDDLYHQKRADKEKMRWVTISRKAKEKAKKAARARWKNHAPSIASSTAQALLENMHEQCTSPSPIYADADASAYPQTADAASDGRKKGRKEGQKKRDKKKRDTPPTKTDFAKARHALFKAEIFEHWRSKNSGIDCPWGPAEGAQLEMWLRANPTVELPQFKTMLDHRAQSDVLYSARPATWVKNLTNFANGPINRYGLPLEKSTGETNGIAPRTTRAERVDAAFDEALARLPEVDRTGTAPDREGDKRRD